MQRKDSDDLLFQPLAAHEAYKEAQGAERPVQIHAHPDGKQAAVEGQMNSETMLNHTITSSAMA